MNKMVEDLYNQAHQSFQDEIRLLEERKALLKECVSRLDSEISEISKMCITKRYDKEFKVFKRL